MAAGSRAAEHAALGDDRPHSAGQRKLLRPVPWGDTAVDEQRQLLKAGQGVEETAADRRQQRAAASSPGILRVPANMTRTLTSVSAKGAGEQGAAQAGGKPGEDYLTSWRVTNGKLAINTKKYIEQVQIRTKSAGGAAAAERTAASMPRWRRRPWENLCAPLF